ncbi:uncharacterized protein BO97DRAFT_423504 [Aspergillus homomorphus CBS 101889]|uniref:Uncharacterized protein n=1 Tax=Aspergillus homomorphus (strain CBS 101889) TaxID=1450537 RepID=A0A395I1V9_ASPHC|nr:hypothetical protein BO97DRAFT_423504 [Aspergillus homomorphus CBS 101889]RAL13725.1 hypothetical protein BO97DRAFT_423504 [Aspergillus homomorphus CBS 101889]
MCAPVFLSLFEHQDDIDLDEAIHTGQDPDQTVRAFETSRIGSHLPEFVQFEQEVYDESVWTDGGNSISPRDPQPALTPWLQEHDLSSLLPLALDVEGLLTGLRRYYGPAVEDDSVHELPESLVGEGGIPSRLQSQREALRDVLGLVMDRYWPLAARPGVAPIADEVIPHGNPWDGGPEWEEFKARMPPHVVDTGIFEFDPSHGPLLPRSRLRPRGNIVQDVIKDVAEKVDDSTAAEASNSTAVEDDEYEDVEEQVDGEEYFSDEDI